MLFQLLAEVHSFNERISAIDDFIWQFHMGWGVGWGVVCEIMLGAEFFIYW